MKKAKILFFEVRGEWYKVNHKGFITQFKNDDFSGNWEFLGVSFHHWRNGIDLRFKEIEDAKQLINGRVWDLDHGSTRHWSGRKITRAYFK